MKKWLFKIWNRRLEIKLSRIPNDEKIKVLVEALSNEIKPGDTSITIYHYGEASDIDWSIQSRAGVELYKHKKRDKLCSLDEAFK